MITRPLHFAYCPSLAFLADPNTKKSDDELTSVSYRQTLCKVNVTQIRAFNFALSAGLA